MHDQRVLMNATTQVTRTIPQKTLIIKSTQEETQLISMEIIEFLVQTVPTRKTLGPNGFTNEF